MSLVFADISHSYGATKALSNIGFEALPGEVTCLLGPSGCGKSTLLRLAAGLLSVQSGSIMQSGKVLADQSVSLPPEKRPVGLVFQDGALFPHMSVAKNIAFGLPKSKDHTQIVERMLESVGLGGFADRYPETLSGGQQQRVALARALAPEPEVMLLDEPFANVDIVLRRKIREDTRNVLLEKNATVILVTHDPEEALEIGDKIVVMENGTIVQQGTPEQLYDQPATPAVARMFGDSQVISGVIEGNKIVTAFGEWEKAILNDSDVGSQIQIVIRPAAFTIIHKEPGIAGLEVKDVRSTGNAQRLIVANQAGETIAIMTSRDRVFSPGDIVDVLPSAKNITAFSQN